MAKYRKKKEPSIDLYFWDGTKPGFQSLPNTVNKWAALIEGYLVYASLQASILTVKQVNTPVWIILDSVNGIVGVKTAAEVTAAYEVDV